MGSQLWGNNTRIVQKMLYMCSQGCCEEPEMLMDMGSIEGDRKEWRREGEKSFLKAGFLPVKALLSESVRRKARSFPLREHLLWS